MNIPSTFLLNCIRRQLIKLFVMQMQLIMDYLFLVDQRALLAVQDRIEIIFDPILKYFFKHFWSTCKKTNLFWIGFWISFFTNHFEWKNLCFLNSKKWLKKFKVGWHAIVMQKVFAVGLTLQQWANPVWRPYQQIHQSNAVKYKPIGDTRLVHPKIQGQKRPLR